MEIPRLRILAVLPLYGGSLSVGRYCVKALQSLGQSVRVFEADKLYAGYKGFRQLDIAPNRLEMLENSFLRLVSQAVWTMAEEQKPQIVLALAQAPLDRMTLAKMRQAGMATVMWFVEDWQVFNYWLKYAPLYDAFAIIQKEPFLSELERIGQKHAFYLPLAALPDFHAPLELSENDQKKYGADIAFLGAGYPNRRLAFRKFANRNFKIWGSDWEGEKILAGNIQEGGRRIDENESVKIYNATKINLNLHSSLQTDNLVSKGDFVNPRTFELAAMGAFQLTDRRKLMPELFEDDELATFESLEELEEKIDYFLSHPQERKQYAMRARERVLRDHSYEARMRSLLHYMIENFGPFNDASIEPDVLKNIDSELRAKICSEMARLGLSADASFNDVVARIRKQVGKLSPFETGILFLAELQKQYEKK